ncbi:hypothetical protein GCM10009639_42320 [Kitasatospora putterlickiae]|uniref:Ricin B lectin domain-containing protein n=1 Tax=Kitasatospora putterlickiae TaxID=221725 RepID=A0ABN1Y8G1_9ACTN
MHSGRCLEIPKASTVWGVQVEQRTCNGNPEQRWSDANRFPDGTRLIVNLNSGLLLDLAGGGSADGTAVVQWAWNGGANQKWSYYPAPWTGPHS